MTKKEITQNEDAFGQISINGSIYHKEIHAFFREANEGKVRIERLEGVDLFVKYKDVIDFKQKKAPILK